MSMFFGGFSAPVNIEIAYHATPERKYRDSVSATTGLPQRTYIYSNGDDIAGEVKIGVGGGKRLDHLGVKVELKGVIGVYPLPTYWWMMNLDFSKERHTDSD